MKLTSYYPPKYITNAVNFSAKKIDVPNPVSDLLGEHNGKDDGSLDKYLIISSKGRTLPAKTRADLYAALKGYCLADNQDYEFFNKFGENCDIQGNSQYLDVLKKFDYNKQLLKAIKFYAPDFNCKYMQKILSAQNANGAPLFSAENLAGLIHAQSTIDMDIENEEVKDYIFNTFINDVKHCNDKERNFLCKYLYYTYMYPVETITKLLNMETFKGKENTVLINFIMSENENMQEFLFSKSNMQTIENLTAYVFTSDFYCSHINTIVNKFFNKINAMNIPNDAKLKLYSNTGKMSEEKLKETKDYINSLDKKSVNQCRNSILTYIISIISEDYATCEPERKITLATLFHSVNDLMNSKEHSLFDKKLQEKYSELMTNIKKESPVLPSKNEDINAFFKTFIFNAGKINNKNADEILTSKDFNDYIEDCAKTGIKLHFSRKKFANILYNTINMESEEKSARLQKKLGIELTNFPVGYNGIITTKNLDENNPTEKKLKAIIDNYFYNNKVVCENKDIADLLNIVIKAFPEFLNVVGKKQHGTHKYTTDIHTLKVLQQVVSDKDYKKLSKLEKMYIKFAMLFHDIAKPENEVDPEHPNKSAEIASSLLSKINLSFTEKNRIVELIRNHHWYTLASSEDENDMKQVSVMFRRPNDLTIAKIMASADINSVADGFSDYVGLDKMPQIINRLKAFQEKMHTFGSFTFPTRIIPKMFEQQAKTEYDCNGKKYNLSVLNFSNKNYNSSGLFIDENKDLRTLGFFNNENAPVYKKDLSFLIHATDLPMFINYINKIGSDINLCTSSVTLDKMATHTDKAFGIILDIPEQLNVGNTYNINQCSGSHKNLYDFANEIWQYPDERKKDLYSEGNPVIFRRKSFMEYFKNIGINLTKEDYAQLYEQMSNGKYLKVKNVLLKSGQEINGKDILRAIQYSDEKLRKFYEKSHNEINIYSPKALAFFARTNSLDEVPVTFIKTAAELNIPIFLFGEPKNETLK